MITTKRWGEYTLRLTQLGGRDLMLVDDLAKALDMNSEELLSKIRDDFVVICHIEDDPNIKDGFHFFLTRKGVYQALWLAETEEALGFQDLASWVVWLHFTGPVTKSDFDFLDSFVPEILRKESK